MKPKSLKLKIQGSNLTDSIIFWLGTENLSFKTDQVNPFSLKVKIPGSNLAIFKF